MVYRLLDRRGKDAKGPESPVSTGTWAGDIKPFLEREATCMRIETRAPVMERTPLFWNMQSRCRFREYG